MPDLGVLLAHIPDVPKLPGVPALVGYATGDDETLATSNVAQVAQIAAAEWGVYDRGGDLVLDPDNVGGVEYSAEYRISDYPMESGEFASYNKVAQPFSARVTMSKGGTLADRQAFETSVGHLQGSLDLVTIVTPERAYLEVNIERVSLVRTAERGAGMLTYEIGFREIRTTGDIQFDSDETGDTASGDSDTPQASSDANAEPKKPTVREPQSPTAARKKSQGSVQPRQPTKADDDRLQAAGFKKQKDGSFVLDLRTGELGAGARAQ